MARSGISVRHTSKSVGKSVGTSSQAQRTQPSSQPQRTQSSSLAQRTQARPSSPSLPDSQHSEHSQIGIHGSSAGSSTYKRRPRGKTRCLGLAKKRRNGEKLNVDVPEALMRFVGPNGQDMITESGYLAREAPLQAKKWSNVPVEAKKKIWASLKDKFQVPNDVDQIDTVVDSQLRVSYKTHRYHMHKHFKKFDTLEEARKIPMLGFHRKIGTILWTTLAQKDLIKRISEINKKNRSKSRLNHIGGTKSNARRRYEKRNPVTGELLPRGILWKDTHYRVGKEGEQGQWVDEPSRIVYEEVEKLGSETQEDGSVLSEDERFVRVLGEKSGYIRGLGAGPKPKTMSKLKSNQAELQKEFDSKLQSMRDEMQIEMETQVQARMSQMESDFQTQLQVMKETFEQQMRELLSTR